MVFDSKTQEPIVVGIYSKSLECDVSVPSVYTRLSVYYAWIYKVAGAEPGNCFSNGPVTTAAPGEATVKTTVQVVTDSPTERTEETTTAEEVTEESSTAPEEIPADEQTLLY